MENPEMKITRCEAPASAGKSSLNPETLNQLLGQMVNDLGAAVMNPRGKTRARHARQQFFEKLRNSALSLPLYLDEPDRLG
jgi:hypothetical protein